MTRVTQSVIEQAMAKLNHRAKKTLGFPLQYEAFI